MLPDFEYFAPETVDQACGLLSQYRERARIKAGGTDLLVRMKQRLANPACVVGTERLADLAYIKYEPRAGLRLGVLTTLHEMETSPLLRERFPMLAQAAGGVAYPQIRNRGTLGGNICLDTRCIYFNQSRSWRQARLPCYKTGGEVCHVVKGGKHCYAILAADTVPAFMGLGARVRLASAQGERLLALEEFYTGRGDIATVLRPDEMAVEVQVPPSHGSGVYLKYSLRGSVDFALVSVAAFMVQEGGVCSTARIALGGVASGPVRAARAEGELAGKKLTPELIGQAAEMASHQVRPLVPLGAPTDYKRRLIRVLVKQALSQAWTAAGP